MATFAALHPLPHFSDEDFRLRCEDVMSGGLEFAKLPGGAAGLCFGSSLLGM